MLLRRRRRLYSTSNTSISSLHTRTFEFVGAPVFKLCSNAPANIAYLKKLLNDPNEDPEVKSILIKKLQFDPEVSIIAITYLKDKSAATFIRCSALKGLSDSPNAASIASKILDDQNENSSLKFNALDCMRETIIKNGSIKKYDTYVAKYKQHIQTGINTNKPGDIYYENSLKHKKTLKHFDLHRSFRRKAALKQLNQ